MDPMRVIPNPVPTSYEPVLDAVPTESHHHLQQQQQQQQLQFQFQQQQQQHPYPAPPFAAQQLQQQQQPTGPHPVHRLVSDNGGGGGMAPNPNVAMAATTVVPVDEGVIGETPTQLFQTQVYLLLQYKNVCLLRFLPEQHFFRRLCVARSR